MANFVPVSKETHGSKRWMSKGNYDFAKTLAMAPITGEETPRATREMPCAFTKVEDRFVLSVILGLQTDTNLFVAPDGRWVGSYTPALFRAYPFRLSKVQGQDNLALMVDEDGGLSSEGEPFFDEEGKPAPKLAQFIEFLTKIEQGRRNTDEVVKKLDEAGLIEEWPLAIKSEDDAEKIRGLYRIGEQKLNQLDDEAFLKLRRSQALPLAYMQLLSMRNIDNLGKLAKAQIEGAQKQAQRAFEFLDGEQEDELKIDWSQFETRE